MNRRPLAPDRWYSGRNQSIRPAEPYVRKWGGCLLAKVQRRSAGLRCRRTAAFQVKKRLGSGMIEKVVPPDNDGHGGHLNPKEFVQKASRMTVLTRLAAKPVALADQNGEIPPLENGDRLTRAEFMRRYDAMPALKKAELVEGVVYVPSPVRHKYHGRQHLHILNWIGHYEAGTQGVEGSDNSTILLDLDNAPQPDAILFIQPEHGGRVKINEDGYIEGGPDLVAEVAASSASYDLHDKLNSYRRNGVREYIVHRVLDQQVDWFVLKDGRFEALEISPDGLFRSTVFPGLWLDPAALVRGDLATVLAVVQQGLNSPEHATFAAGLQATPFKM
jgi:Uma2 family endonuclease